jgi:hypothetical protein
MIYHPPGAWTADDDYRLNQIIRMQPPPRVTAPGYLRDDSGRIVAERPVAPRERPDGPWDSNGRQS